MTDEVQELNIKDPKLTELNSSNTGFSVAINKIKEHLTKLNVPIDSMYFTGIDSTSSENWRFRLIHYNSYLEHAKYDLEKERIDSLEKAGVNDYSLNPPLTGNWGDGYDRTLLYSTDKDEIIADLVDQ